MKEKATRDPRPKIKARLDALVAELEAGKTTPRGKEALIVDIRNRRMFEGDRKRRAVKNRLIEAIKRGDVRSIRRFGRIFRSERFGERRPRPEERESDRLIVDHAESHALRLQSSLLRNYEAFPKTRDLLLRKVRARQGDRHVLLEAAILSNKYRHIWDVLGTHFKGVNEVPVKKKKKARKTAVKKHR